MPQKFGADSDEHVVRVFVRRKPGSRDERRQGRLQRERLGGPTLPCATDSHALDAFGALVHERASVKLKHVREALLAALETL